MAKDIGKGMVTHLYPEFLLQEALKKRDTFFWGGIWTRGYKTSSLDRSLASPLSRNMCSELGPTLARTHELLGGGGTQPGGSRTESRWDPGVQWGCCCLDGAAHATTCPPGIQARSAFALLQRPQCPALPWPGPRPPIYAHLCYRGAPQEHVSGVKACELHPTLEQGHGG